MPNFAPNMGKRGQVSIFIIIGVILLIILAAYFALTFSQVAPPSKMVNLPLEFSGIRDTVDTCLDSSMGDVLDAMAARGGYLSPDNPMIEYNYAGKSLDIPYYIYEGNDTSPSENTLLEELNLGMGIYAAHCFTFNNSNYQAEPVGNLSYSFLLGEKTVTVTANYPIRFTSGTSTATIDTFSAQHDTTFVKDFNFAKNWTKSQLSRKDSFCYTCFYDEANSSSIDAETEEINVGDGMAIIYSLDKSFVFGHKLVYKQTTQPFQINDIPDQTAESGYDWVLQLSATKPAVNWSTDSLLVNITQDGNLYSKPTDNDVGNHGIKVTAKSADGQTASNSFMLDVTSPRGGVPYAPDITLIGNVSQPLSYDIGSLVGPGVVYSGAYDQFTINSTTGKFNFTPNKTGVFVYEYYVINKTSTRVSQGEISIFVS